MSHRIVWLVWLVWLAAPSGIAAAGCPLNPGPAQPVLATAEVQNAQVRYAKLHRVSVTMQVPVHIDLEIRIVASEVPPEERDGMVGAVNKLADEIARGVAAGIEEKLGIAISVSPTAQLEVMDPEVAAAQLSSQGFTKEKDSKVEYQGRTITGAVWIRGTPRMETRTVNAQSLRSRAVLRVSARACVDDRQGLIGLVPTVQVVDFGPEVQPGAPVSESDKAARHAQFMQEANAEAERVRQELSQLRHPVSADEAAAMRAKNGATFPVKIPFHFFEEPAELTVNVTSLTQPVVNEALGRD